MEVWDKNICKPVSVMASWRVNSSSPVSWRTLMRTEEEIRRFEQTVVVEGVVRKWNNG